MVVMVALYHSVIRFSRLLIHLIDGDLAGGVEKCGTVGHYSSEVVDLVLCLCFAYSFQDYT